ncbi:hypothetical protein EBS40_09165 [bacterium]|nr:hypothetical protein [bacterium]
MTTAIVAVITGVFGILTIWVQARVHRDNRNDHAATAAVVQTTAAAVELLAEGHKELIAGQSEIKADLREVKADLRDHSQRLRLVEAVEPVEPPKRTRRKPA